jgi:hypothetical protein
MLSRSAGHRGNSETDGWCRRSLHCVGHTIIIAPMEVELPTKFTVWIKKRCSGFWGYQTAVSLIAHCATAVSFSEGLGGLC